MSATMKQRTVQLSVFLLLTALTLPSVGPLIDHHFAERQPGHVHIAAVIHSHAHSYDDIYHHHHDNTGYSGYTPIVVNYDSSLADAPDQITADLIESILLFEPTSYFLLPSMADKLMRLKYAAPPRHPPKALLQAF